MSVTKEETVLIPAADLASLQSRLAASNRRCAARRSRNPRSIQCRGICDCVFDRATSAKPRGPRNQRKIGGIARSRPSSVVCRRACTNAEACSRQHVRCGRERVAYVPQGRIVELRDYKLADDFDARFPFPGAEEDKTNEKGQPSVHYRQHCYSEGWRKDLNEYVGKAFDPTLNPEVCGQARKAQGQSAGRNRCRIKGRGRRGSTRKSKVA